MKTLWYVPIESLAERYTGSWYANIPPWFDRHGCKVRVIDGEALSDTVDVGTFLDINSTVAFKASQMQSIAKLFRDKAVKDGDIFFIADLEFWGVEALRLMADMNRINIFIFAFCHAASYTNEDAFEIAEPYQKYTELGWLRACDMVFVGSEYHEDVIIEERIKPYVKENEHSLFYQRVMSVGNPLFQQDYPPFPGIEKQKQIVLPNRFDWEKRPNLSLDFAYLLKKRNPDLRVVVTTSRKTFKSNRKWLVDYARGLEQDGVIEIRSGLTKGQYHLELAKSKVMLSNSIEENFGYCIVEAMAYGVVPIVKNAYSHPEVVGHEPMCLFDCEDEILDKVEAVLNGEATFEQTMLDGQVAYYYHSMDRMWHAMNEFMTHSGRRK